MLDISAVIGRIAERSLAHSEQIKKDVTTCVGCDNGKVRLVDDGGQAFSGWCPLLSKGCRHGAELSGQMSRRFFRALCQSGIPAVHCEPMKSVQPSDALSEAKRWDWRATPFLVLLGDKGVGKSFAAAYAYMRWCWNMYEADDWRRQALWPEKEDKARRSLSWLHVFDVATYSFGWGYEKRAAASNWLEAPFLVIDDLSSEDASVNSKAKINYVISRRYDSQLPMIITGNMDRNTLWERYGERIGERLSQCGRIACVGGVNCRRTA